MINAPWHPESDVTCFPDPNSAMPEPDGLVLIGGNLSVQTLVNAYTNAIFPWYEENQPILWWSPSVRAVIDSQSLHISKNMRKFCNNNSYSLRADTSFVSVVKACSERDMTWISDDMKLAYSELYKMGIAHSIEVFDQNNILVGGLYGVFVKNSFCGESMFSSASNVSKLALIHLVKFLNVYGCNTVDCQMQTEHLTRMGARDEARDSFLQKLRLQKANKKLDNKNWGALWQRYWQ